MNRDEKATAVKEITEELSGAQAIFAVNYRGISVSQAAELRTKLREADASFNVVKNRLAKRATADTDTTALDEHLVGPTALTYVKGDPVLAAKAITGFIKEHETISYKGGIMEGAALDADQFKAISKLPGVDELRGQLVGMVATPINGVVRGLNQLIQGLALQLGSVAEQGLVGGDAPAPAAETPTDADEPAADGDETPAGDPAPDTAGEPEVDAPADESGESDNPGGDSTPDVGDDDSSDQAENEEGQEASDDSAADGDESKED